MSHFAPPDGQPYTLAMLKAIVFDFDGVVVDSEPIHYQALIRVGRTFGADFDYQQYLRYYIGFDDRDAFREMMLSVGLKPDQQRIAELCQQKQEVFEDLVRQGAAAIPGAVELIREAHGRLPLAIASGATRRDIDLMLAGLDLRDHFHVIVAADDVARSKPDPTTYRLAYEQLSQRHGDLDLKPGNCLAIEDTPAGIASARGAGLLTLGIATTGPADALHQAHRVEPGLQNVNLQKLHEWFDGVGVAP